MDSKQLGNYEVIEKIGAGGMGEVYRARDARLGRDVALKILPQIFADDADRLGRFEREARLLAALNHPGIGAIYGLEQAEGYRFLVLELVPGEDLSQRIMRGPISLDEALPIARDIAEAVEFAHEQGVVHRDLKPANVKITPDGRVKVLDFGLAKAFDSDDPRDPRLSQSPTLLASSPSIAGVILGTAAYMSPEQARGKTVDKRSDVFAFGCLLYEMLTGRQAFEGDTISDTLASVLKTHPDLAMLPIETSRAIRDLLKRCLEKDPKLRMRDIGEARIAIDHARHAGADETAASAPGAAAPARRGRRDLAWGAALLAVAAVAFFGAKRMSPAAPEAPLRKFVIDMEEQANTVHDQRLAVSPDGSRIAFVYEERLWVRELAKLEATELPGTEDADCPAWSPDGTQIAYRVGATYYRIPADGGTPTAITATSLTFTGGSGTWWTEDGRILFGTGSTGVMQVSAMGGDPTEIPVAEDETDVHEPSELPGGRGILYAAHLKVGGPSEIRLLADGKRTTLVKVEDQRLWSPRYASSGHILYRRTPNNPGIWALPFSLASMEATGEPFLVAGEGAEPCPGPGGLLVHVVGGAEGAVEIAMLNRDGTVDSKLDGVYEIAGMPAISPDGKRLAVVTSESNNGDVWVIDLARGTRTRLTFASGWDILPSWSPDGKFVYYTTPADRMTYEVPADGSGKARPIHRGFSMSVSRDGKWMAFDADVPKMRSDVFVMPFPADTSTAAVPLVATSASENSPRISPDGRYVTYQSNESGQSEIYLTRFPEPGGKWQVSTHGGTRARWDPAGGKLYYTTANEVMEVDVTTTPTLELGTPRPLFDISKARMVLGRTASFDVFPGGKKFVVTYAGEMAEKPRLRIIVVENWPSEFKPATMAKK